MFLRTYILLAFAVVIRGELPKFRILAPEFICPKDEDSAIDKPDNTIITLQTPAGALFRIVWTVRWENLVAPSQRFTLLIWRTVRALEAKLNKPQPEQFVYVIPNEELLTGVNYIFNITAIEPNGESSAPKIFHIDNTKGDTKLDLVEGRTDLLYVVLVGSQTTYADTEFVLEALVTSCFHNQDYYFKWSVRGLESDEVIDESTTGSRLVIPPNTLKPWVKYDADCQVIKNSNGFRLTQPPGTPYSRSRIITYYYYNKHTTYDWCVNCIGLRVTSRRSYQPYFRHEGGDSFTGGVPVDQPLAIEPTVVNPDYVGGASVFMWECTVEEAACEDFYDFNGNNTFVLPNGLSTLGEYQVKLSVTIQDQTAEAIVLIKTVKNNLPVIQISPLPRLLNEGNILRLVANASNVAPTCNLTWYFATEDALAGGLEESEYGVALSDTITIYSFEETFLNELTDFTNETEYRQVVAEIEAKAGLARFVAVCGCSVTFACESQGLVYAELRFELNQAPKAGRVKVFPETGTAMETMFRISTLAATDPNTPLKYTFYCRIGSDEAIVLGSYSNYLAVETFLPYIDGGTEVWVEVCDSLGACSNGDPTTVMLSNGEGSTSKILVEDFKGHLRRCEMQEAQNVMKMTIITYKNSEQAELLTSFSEDILKALPPDAQCMEAHAERYTAFLHWLALQGVDTSALELAT